MIDTFIDILLIKNVEYIYFSDNQLVLGFQT